MKKTPLFSMLLWAHALLLPVQSSMACSGYKITTGNKTMFGSNEDAWRLTPRVWFENASPDGPYGAAFTGSRYDGENGYAPQTGMNEMGLAFERLASHYPEDKSKRFTGRKAIANPTRYLKDILHSCKNVDEVQAYISRYDHSYFLEDVFLYVDKTGKYLMVEPYTIIAGNEATYVTSNFCPSITAEKDALTLDRYRKGLAFLKNKIDTTLAFCTALSDTMHVCRTKIGDGTLLSSVWDLNSGLFNLFFYHRYNKTVQFNLKQELAKGDHILDISTLFPHNPEFEKLRQYKIPKNTMPMAMFIMASAALFLFSSVFFLIRWFKSDKNAPYAYLRLLLVPLGLVMFYDMFVLSGSVNVFYFAAPYKDPEHLLVSAASYVPFVLLPVLIWFCILNFKLFKDKLWSRFEKLLFALNTLVYIVLTGLFVYWGFYNVF